MALIVLHDDKKNKDKGLEDDVTHMGNHYGQVTHLLAGEIANYTFPNAATERTIHILSHGSEHHVGRMEDDEFKAWMVKAFQMSKYRQLAQTYFIYSCDVATGTPNLLQGVAEQAANSQVKNRTFIGTAGENGVCNTQPGAGKVLMKTKGGLQTLGVGWKGYRTVFKTKNVAAEKMPEQDVNKIVRETMNW